MPRTDALSEPFEAWFAGRGWTPFDFQREVWTAMAQGRSGLLHATTGAGKTYAVWLGALARAQALGQRLDGPTPDLSVLWLTPMRALSADTQRAIVLPTADLAPRWTTGLRTGDTPSAERARQDKRLPSALVTTPESFTLLLTRADAHQRLRGIHTVVVDEWHEMVGNKRGVQVQLALARLKRWNPLLVVWGLSATLGNLEGAMGMLLGPQPQRPAPRLVRGRIDKALVVDTLLPAEPGRFSWGGHLGAQMREPVVREIERSTGSTLVFTNVRSQAEAWYQMLLQARPEWAGEIALHHGSLDKAVREWVEAQLKAGTLRAVVATSSLDLGVDFLPVERVLQIGSAKGVARLLQRAGRSGHQPGRASRITLVPTNTLELIEAVAARRAIAAGRVEPRHAPEKPLDVLVQHLVSMALGGSAESKSSGGDPRAACVATGFVADELFDEVRSTWSYRGLTREEFQWALDFVVRGGDSLTAYPEYHRVVQQDGVHRVIDRGIALRHRLQVGTIVGETSMRVAWWSKAGGGGSLGQVEESFIARLKAGDCFVFGGRVLEYVRTQDMVAYVRKATGKRGIVPSWAGGKMPLSSELADATLQVLAELPTSKASEPELESAGPMLDAQRRLSHLPLPGRLLLERFSSREGQHLFLYPFAGRHVHLGLASLLAWRLSQHRPNTFSISVNDYGFELLAAEDVDIAALLDGSALAADGSLLADVMASLNSSELALRRFREIARVSGLVFTGYPGAPKSTRQVQASAGLFYEVFRKYDPGNRLLGQAEGEVLAQELDLAQLTRSLARMQAQPLDVVTLRAPSPFALALMVERFREQLSTEKLADRLARIVADAQKVLDEPAAPARRRRNAPSRSTGR
ncbi:MAG: ligase-associated DNA damage response DEXH box helicase [Ideonella sp.]|nr:ligase-associated DNA damage response DEXH box helicase [Ideonella sp.]